MWKVLLLITMTNSSGHTEGFNFQLLVKTPSECFTRAEGIISQSVVKASMERHQITSHRAFCTDAKEELSFWPIPDKPPIPSLLRKHLYQSI